MFSNSCGFRQFQFLVTTSIQSITSLFLFTSVSPSPPSPPPPTPLPQWAQPWCDPHCAFSLRGHLATALPSLGLAASGQDDASHCPDAHLTGLSRALSSSHANSSGCLQPARSVLLSFPERESLNCICLIASHFKFYVRCFVADFYDRSHVLRACRLSQTL